jgi:mannosyltransferase OCH1-like enzyme
MIPRILHQTAKSAVVPEKWRPLQERLRELHPDWEYHLWDDEANLALLTRRRPDLLPCYESMPRPIMRADMIRYVYMDLFGGLYLDTDYEFLKPFDLGEKTIVLPRESEDDQPLRLGNSVFASVPGHPFWKAVLLDLKNNPPGARSDFDEDQVILLTGPGFLTRVFHEKFVGDPSVHIPRKNEFNPPIPREDRAYKALVRAGEAYGIHYCFGSWRVLSLKDRVVRKLKKWGLPL